MAAAKTTPKDAQVMQSILREVGLADYEPRVLNQMLEFTYRYVTTILEDAQQFSLHAKKKLIDLDDIKLSMQLHVDRHFTPPPPRELLLDLARQKNGTLLPLIKSTAGPRLPPDRYSLTSCNYRLKSSRKPKVVSAASRLNIASFQPNLSVNKLNSTVGLNNKGGPALSVVTKAVTNPTVTIVPRPLSSATMQKPTPTPIIKFSDGNRSLVPTSAPVSVPYSPSVTGSMPSQIVMPTLVVKSETSSIMEPHGEKRKRDDDDDDMDYDS